MDPIPLHESPEHCCWKMKLAEKVGKKGYRVGVEEDGADLASEKDEKRIAVEIETGESDVEGNIKRDLEAGFDEVWIVWNGPDREIARRESVFGTSAEPRYCEAKV